jgi:hypothetical protein
MITSAYAVYAYLPQPQTYHIPATLLFRNDAYRHHCRAELFFTATSPLALDSLPLPRSDLVYYFLQRLVG